MDQSTRTQCNFSLYAATIAAVKIREPPTLTCQHLINSSSIYVSVCVWSLSQEEKSGINFKRKNTHNDIVAVEIYF